MSSEDRAALVALFRSTGGTHWKRKKNWGTDADLSKWYGVYVINGRVVKLNLRYNNLRVHINISAICLCLPAELGSRKRKVNTGRLHFLSTYTPGVLASVLKAKRVQQSRPSFLIFLEKDVSRTPLRSFP
ncbi:unnamed protein product [Ectocarpus sp. 12 AP-2014]